MLQGFDAVSVSCEAESSDCFDGMLKLVLSAIFKATSGGLTGGKNLASRSKSSALDLSSPSTTPSSAGTKCFHTTCLNCFIYRSSASPSSSVLIRVSVGLGGCSREVTLRTTSSKRGSTTIFGSWGSETTSLSRPRELARLAAMEGRRKGDVFSRRMSMSSLYSGRCAKLLGLTKTWYVPGELRSAFLSLSSSLISFAKGGRSSGTDP